MRRTIDNPLLLALLASALLALPASAQTANQPQPQNQQPQPNLSSDALKPQQNSADEATVKGTMADGVKPGDVEEQGAAAKKVEDAAAAAKAKSDATTGTAPKPQ